MGSTSVNALWVAFSLCLLFVGAEGLVRGSSSLASRMGLSPLVIGLTVVAYGTSAPEMIVSVKAALASQGEIAVGNVIGSNSLNIGIILGITALLCPVPVKWQVIKWDVPVMLGVALLASYMLLNGRLGRMEGGLLFAGALTYTGFSLFQARKGASPDISEEFAQASQADRETYRWILDTSLVAWRLLLSERICWWIMHRL